jgi:hypothetical protein
MGMYQILAGHREYVGSAVSATRRGCCFVLDRNSDGKMKGKKLKNLEVLFFRQEGVKNTLFKD